MSRPKGPEDIFEHDYLEFYRSPEFWEYVEEYERKPVRNYIGKLLTLRTGVSPHPDADYVTNGVLAKVFVKIDDRVYRGATTTHRFRAFRLFLYTVARRDALDHARMELGLRGAANYEKEVDRRAVREYEQEASCAEAPPEDARLVELRSALERLTPLDRLVVLGVAEGRPYRDLAEEVGCSEVSLRVRRSRAMARLSQWLNGETVLVDRHEGRNDDE